MAGIKSEQLLTHAGFPLGVNNLAPEGALPRADNGAQLAVREAQNLDFNAAGHPVLRTGYSFVRLLSSGHSGWSDDYLPFGLLVDADTLYAIDEDGSATALVAGLSPGLPVSYCRIHDSVYWSNGQQSGQVTREGELRPWAAPLPPAVPTLTPASGGSLDPGTWQVTLTLVDAWGRESGAPRARTVEVTDGAIALTHIPPPPPGGAVRIYAAHGTSAELRAAFRLEGGLTEATLDLPPKGRPLETLLLRVMPPGQLVAHGNGRQFVARGKDLFFSPPLRYGLVDKRGHVGFVARIDLLAFVGDGTDGAGLFVADGKRTYFLAGANPEAWRFSPISAHGAMPGQIAMVPGEVFPELGTKQLLPVWVARNGRLTVGTPGGALHYPQPADYGQQAVFDAAESAAVMFRESAGDQRVIAALRGASPASFAMKDAFIVREIRHDE